MKVLITGHHGYLGSVMARRLREAGHDVTGLDAGFFRGCTLGPQEPEVPARWKDLRDVTPRDLEGFEAVVHLAALSNDPLGDLDPQLTHAINRDATVRLALAAREAGVRRFLFSSSCIMYGVSELARVTEDSPLAPQTAYAASKVEAERALRELATNRFSPVFLRNGTVYGFSPRMRFDTVLNSFVASALATGVVVVRGDGRPWRPVVHIEDVAAAFLAALEAPAQRLHAEAINVGDEALNCQVADLAQLAADAVPGARVEVRGEPDADQRTYQTDFGKIHRLLPALRVRYTPATGARQLAGALRAAGFAPEDASDAHFVRLRWLRRLLETGQLSESLRWRQPQAVEAR